MLRTRIFFTLSAVQCFFIFIFNLIEIIYFCRMTRLPNAKPSDLSLQLIISSQKTRLPFLKAFYSVSIVAYFISPLEISQLYLNT